LFAAHIRTTHVHGVVEADVKPEVVMTTLKAYASRRLNLIQPGLSGRKYWSRHGSTRWIWNDDDLANAMRYVIDGQGEIMALFQLPRTEL